jgi:hypothetical protein
VKRLTVTPGPMELGLNRPAYEALVEDLREQGYEAELEPPIEERFGLPMEMVNVAITVWEEIDAPAITVIVTKLLDRMLESRKPPPQPPSQPPTARLYGAKGEVLWEGEIPDQDAADVQDPGTNSQHGR